MLDADDVLMALPAIVRAPGYAIVWLFTTRRNSTSGEVNLVLAWILGILFWIAVVAVAVLFFS